MLAARQRQMVSPENAHRSPKPGVLLGVSIPALIYVLSRVAVALWIEGERWSQNKSKNELHSVLNINRHPVHSNQQGTTTMQQSKAHVIKNATRNLKPTIAARKADYFAYRYGRKVKLPDVGRGVAHAALSRTYLAD